MCNCKGCNALTMRPMEERDDRRSSVSPAQVVPQAAGGEGERDKFKCLYLLVETAVAVRQREKEAEEVPV